MTSKEYIDGVASEIAGLAQNISGIEDRTMAPKPPQVPIEDQAAKTYDSLVPLWDRFARNTNKKSLIRVVSSAVKWPLQDKVPKFQTQVEFEAFKMLCTILDCKTIMISSVVEERMKKQEEKLLGDVTEKETGEVNVENS